MDDQRHILELTPEELLDWFEQREEPSYRVDQLLDWLYLKFAGSFGEMTNLSKDLRAALEESFSFEGLQLAERAFSEDGKTEKFSFELADGEIVESVSMEADTGFTYCISSQAGCALNCAFCATGAMGFGRDLRTFEVLGQVLQMARAKGALGNVVFMGMGEPLLNLNAVMPALEALTDERRFALGTRRITVSTAGVTPGIERLSRSPARPNLALSLNSPFDGQRSELMPVNEKYPLGEVLAACERYAERTGRRLMLEYVLLGGVNTSKKAARAVAGMALRLGAMVNLIPFNPVEDHDLERPARTEIERFEKTLEGRGVTVTRRYRRGQDIAAGCGQLAARGENKG
jgi:23S rRNA (adenine2503-C2)-methyltransferase